MRRQKIEWTIMVLAIVLTIYGSFSLIYNHTHDKEFSILGLIFLILGFCLLVLYLVLGTISYVQKRKNELEHKDDKPEVIVSSHITKQEIENEEYDPSLHSKEVTRPTYSSRDDVSYSNERNVSRYDISTIYVRQVGYGPVLRVTGNQILDMRSNTYYTIEGSIVHQNGSGPVFEISGNRIRQAFGSYLFEISGSNVNKTFGGFYASFSGNYLQTFDLREKYEISESLSTKQRLTVVALLFGRN